VNECPNCKHENEAGEEVCSECGHQIVSGVDDTMDQLIEAASIPNLASLFRQGKKRGLITAVDIGSGKPA
jgi:hypothetical protein